MAGADPLYAYDPSVDTYLYIGPKPESNENKHTHADFYVFAECCMRMFNCVKCHDAETDHKLQAKDAKQIMCKKCMKLQPISSKCANSKCDITF